MSDFFTKKQRKFWCETCKIFIEYTKLSIDQHQRSKNHLRLINRDIEYKSQKAKFQKMHGLGQQTQVIDTNNPTLNISNKTQQIDPLTGYLPEEMKDKFLNKKRNFPNFNNNNSETNSQQNRKNDINQSNNPSRNYSQGLNSILLDEIKKEKMKTDLTENTLNMVNRNWTMHWDYMYNIPYYFNHSTRQSQWEKPPNFELNNHINFPNNNFKQQNPFNQNNNTNTDINKDEKSSSEDEIEEESEKHEEENRENAGIIGKWEIVEKDQSIFSSKNKKDEGQEENNDVKLKEEKNQYKDEESDEQNIKDNFYMPGLINREEFLLNEYGKELDDSESEDEKSYQKYENGLNNFEDLEENNEKDIEDSKVEQNEQDKQTEKTHEDISNKITFLFSRIFY